MRNNTIKESISHGLEVRTSMNHWRERPKTGRIYVDYGLGHTPEPTGPRCTDLDCESATCRIQRESGRPDRCEIDHKVWNRWLRSARRDQKERILPALAEHFEVKPEQIRMRFSQKAGCSCGCSPGWIVDGCGAWNTNTWVNLTKRIGPGSILASNIAAIAREVNNLTRV